MATDSTKEKVSTSNSLTNSDAPIDQTAASKTEVEENAVQSDGTNYLSGWRLHTLTLGLCLGIFLVNFEISIVSTSLVSITDDLKHFSQSSWVITAYLLTYTSFMIIIAKLSDVYGRKTMILLSMFLFTVFSGGCAAAQTMTQLIVCRAFQGMGGCGVYSLVMVILFEMIPPVKYPLYSVIVTLLFSLAMTTGPIFGGLINDNSSWIWVFLLNVPGGVVAMLLLGISIPKHFPNHGVAAEKRKSSSIGRIDFVGGVILLAAMTMHITGLEQAANMYAWTSREVLAPLILSAPLWISFFVSQYFITKPSRVQEPLFPWRFCTNRVVMGLIINSFLSGAVSTTCIIQIPLRSQAAVGTTPLQAGIRLIPMSLTIQVGAMAVAVLAKKRRMPPIYLALVGSVMQLVGCVFLSRGSPDNPDWDALYGIEAVTGIGTGLAIGVVTLMMPFAIEKRDLSVATAAVVQFRFLGGATALAIVTAVANNWLGDTLPNLLNPKQIAMIFRAAQTIDAIPEPLQSVVRGVFVKSFNLQMRILIGFAAAQLPVSFLAWKKEQIMLE